MNDLTDLTKAQEDNISVTLQKIHTLARELGFTDVTLSKHEMHKVFGAPVDQLSVDAFGHKLVVRARKGYF